MPSALKLRAQKSVENFRRGAGVDMVAGQAEDIGIVVLAGVGRGVFIAHQRGANPGHFIGGNAHAHASGTDEDTKFRFAQGHTVRHRLGILGRITGVLGSGPKIGHAHAPLGQVLLQGFFQLEPAMIGANGDGRRSVRGDQARGFPLFDEVQQRRNPLLDLIAAVQIHLIGATDRIADVFLEEIQRFVEFAQQKGFFGCFRKRQHHRIDMVMGHANDIIGLAHQLGSDRPAAQVGNVDAQFSDRLHGVRAGRLAFHSPKPSRKHPVIAASLRGQAKNALGHRAAADVSRADKKDVLHLCLTIL